MTDKAAKAAAQKRWYEKHRARHLANVATRKAAIVAETVAYVRQLKEATPCLDCGKSYPYYVMDFDHLGDKEYAINRMMTTGYSIAAVQQEIDKCELVCSNCHRERTHRRAHGGIV